jgi:ElaB/YqjD/DUF883 family membrane-anchored ribosome-binding protein
LVEQEDFREISSMAASSEKDLADTLDRIRADLAALSGTVTQLVTDTAGIQKTLKQKVNSAAKQAGAAGEALVSDAMEMGEEALNVASRTASAALGNVEGQIVRNPMAAVAVALGLGFVIGIVTRK